MRLRDTDPHDFLMFLEVYFGNDCSAPQSYKADDVVVDIGAHIGCHAVRAIHVGAGHVVAVEPRPDNFELLFENLNSAVQASKKGKFTAIEAAVYDGRPKVTMAPGQTTSMDYISQPHDSHGYEVRGVTLDSIIEDLDNVRFLKMDIEGAECVALHHSKMLKKCQEISVEVHMPFCHPSTVSGILVHNGFEVLPARELLGGRAQITARRK